MNDDTPPARSIESKISSHVIFCNNTGRKINLKWLDYSGDEISYGVLNEEHPPSPMNTFVTHPWVALDEENQRKMWLNSKEIFYPPAPQFVRVGRRGNHVGIRIIPTNVAITVPVYNAEKLQDSCCQVLAKAMTVSNINQLEIPEFLKSDIKQRIKD